MAKPIITHNDFYVNPQLQGSPANIVAVPGAANMYVDGLPILTTKDTLLPAPDAAVPTPSGVFFQDSPVVLSQDPTQTGGIILGPNRTPSVFV